MHAPVRTSGQSLSAVRQPLGAGRLCTKHHQRGRSGDRVRVWATTQPKRLFGTILEHGMARAYEGEWFSFKLVTGLRNYDRVLTVSCTRKALLRSDAAALYQLTVPVELAAGVGPVGASMCNRRPLQVLLVGRVPLDRAQ